MQVEVIFKNWCGQLASIFMTWRAQLLERNSVVVTREGERFIVRPSGAKGEEVLAFVDSNGPTTDAAYPAVRNQFIVFDLPFDKIVTRHVAVPIQAREFVSGIVGNQIERLSPWPQGQMVYGISAETPRDGVSTLDVGVVIASKATINAAREELTARGLTPSRIRARARAAVDAPLVTLWSDATHAEQQRPHRLPQMIGGSLAAALLLSISISGWALYSMNATWSAYADIAAQASILRQRGHMAHRSIQLTALAPAERAWALKQRSPASILILDQLSRALPDGAYLTHLRLEGTKLTLVGMADDAPSLVATLERSHHFTKVQFFAPTVKSRDSALYRFSISAWLAPYSEAVKQ